MQLFPLSLQNRLYLGFKDEFFDKIVHQDAPTANEETVRPNNATNRPSLFIQECTRKGGVRKKGNLIKTNNLPFRTQIE